MSRFYTLSNEEFAPYKRRANHMLRHHIDQIDVAIRSIVIDINDLEGVATVWSCSSHPETKRVGDRKLHVICVVTEVGAKNLDKVYQEWTRALIPFDAFHVPLLSSVRLVKLDCMDPEPEEEDLYYAVELSVQVVRSIKSRRIALATLDTAVRNVLF